MKTTKKVKYLLWALNNAIKSSKQSFIVQTFYDLESVLNILYKDGWILGYKKHKQSSYIEIFLKYDSHDRVLVTKAKNIVKPSLLPCIRLKELFADSTNTTYTGVIRSAKYGFLSNRVALSKKTGGIYLAKIY